jgi:hypothetical protein
MKSWYAGYADKYDINRGLLVKYVDGDKRYHDLTTATYHVLIAADCETTSKKRSFTETEVDTVRSMVECPICYEYFTDPHSLPCTHTYCKACIQETFKDSKHCPICKLGFLLRESRPNPMMKTLCDLFTSSSQTTSTTSFGDSAQTTSTTSLGDSSQTPPSTTSFGDSAQTTPSASSLSVLSSDPLKALAQISGAGTYNCSTCRGRKHARNHKCLRPCPRYF